MRVFKIGFGVLALMFGLAGSVRAESMPDKDIVDTAASAGSFKTLVAAVQAAGLVDALKGQGPLTIFAPTDEAFNKLPAGTIENLLKPENKDKLIAVLTYHVVPGRLSAKDLIDAAKRDGGQTRLTTVEGEQLTVMAKGNTLTVWDSKGGTSTITIRNVFQSNGVIHVVDKVLLPS
jgi:uncharacterized surface protein with fasciclin (FAS1) repeats